MLVEFYFNNQLIPIANVKEIRIRESINSPIIEGEILIYDFNLIDYEIIKTQKEIPINILVYDLINDDNLEIVLTTTGIDGGTTQHSNLIALKFTNRYSIDLNAKITTSYFENTLYSKMLVQLLTAVGFKVNKKKLVESGNQDTRYFPYTSNLDKIRYIQERAVDKNNNAGFLIFPDLFTNEMNVLNLDYIMKEKFGVYTYPLYKNYEQVAYIGHIEEIITIKNYDVFDFIDGSSADRFTFNLDTGKVENVSKDITSVKDLPLLLNEEYLSNDYNKKVWISQSSSNGLNNFTSSEFYSFIQRQINLNVVVNGDYNRKVGYIVMVVATKNDTTGSVIDDKLSGKYIIKDLEHLISSKVYMQNLNLIKI